MPQTPIPDFGELKGKKSDLAEERFKLTGFKHKAVYSIGATDSKPTRVIPSVVADDKMHRRYNEFPSHQGKWTYQLPQITKMNQTSALQSFKASSPV